MNVVSETRHLRLLVALEGAGTLHAAARRLHLSPSALSQQLRELEQRLGGPLFIRRRKRLEATPAGKRLLAGARSVLGELERVEDEARKLMAGSSDTIRFAIACHQSYRWLPQVLTEYANLQPTVDVSIVAEAAAAPAEWLLSRKLDVALYAGQRLLDRRLKSRRLFRDELVAVVARSHPWAALQRVQPRAFASEQLFADERALRREEPLGRELAESPPRKLTLVPMTGSVALDLVRANLGVTVMPKWTVSPLAERDGLALLRVGSKGLWLDWFLATRSEPAPRPLATFLTTLREHHPRRFRSSSS